MNPASPESIFRLAGVTAATEVFRARPASPGPAGKPMGISAPEVGLAQRSGHPQPSRRAPSPPVVSPSPSPPPAIVVAQLLAPGAGLGPPPAHLPPAPAASAWPDHLACLRRAGRVRAHTRAAGDAWTALCDLLARGAANGLTLGAAAHTLAWELPEMAADQRHRGLVSLKKALRLHLFACPWAAFGLLAHGGIAGLRAVEGAVAQLVERLSQDLDAGSFLADTLRLEAVRCGVVWRLWIADRIGEDTCRQPLASLSGLRGDLGLVLDRSGRRHAARRGGLPPLAGDLAGAWAREALACVLCLAPDGPAVGRAGAEEDAAAAAAPPRWPWSDGAPPAAGGLHDEVQALHRAAEASRGAHHGLLPLLPPLDGPRRSFEEALARQAWLAAQQGATSLREVASAGAAALAQRVADRLCPRLAAWPHNRRRGQP